MGIPSYKQLFPFVSVSFQGTSNKVLFVENLPEWCTNFALQQLFSQAEGLVDIRAILFKKVAFVEYANEALATKALNSQSMGCMIRAR